MGTLHHKIVYEIVFQCVVHGSTKSLKPTSSSCRFLIIDNDKISQLLESC